jgi:FtsH-binding integral membrane protein
VQRHDLDPIALVFGATFVALGLLSAIGRWTWIDLDAGGGVLGTFLIALGVAGIVSVTYRRRHVPTAPTDEFDL